VGACVGEEMDEDADVYAGMVGVGLCKGAGLVSGAGTSSNETLTLSPLSLDEVKGSKSCGSQTEMYQTACRKTWDVHGAQAVSRWR